MNKKVLMKVESPMQAVDYLRLPYGRTVFPESDGSFRAEIVEFPGCIATGATAQEALAKLEVAAKGWLEATVAKGLSLPDPIDAGEFSGKLLLRMPKSLHRRAAHFAAQEGVSLNQYIVVCLAEKLGTASQVTLEKAWQTNIQVSTAAWSANLSLRPAVFGSIQTSSSSTLPRLSVLPAPRSSGEVHA